MMINEQIEYIKANGEYYIPREPGVQQPKMREGYYFPVCYIKKKIFGRYEVLFHDELKPNKNGYYGGSNQIPNTRLVLYPSGIEEIKYATKSNNSI